jgi:2-amino-4-hydroxy-6-hydroxymethyldihydropteridine diphosphokinase
MNTAYLLIGGNLGDRAAYLALAVQHISALCGFVTSTSSIYETAAWGNTNQPAFYNQAIKLDTALSPEALLQALLAIELDMGRVREEKYGPRTIDLDILMINNIVVDTPMLTIPHPQLHNRRFALLPLNEIAPALHHPVLDKTIHELLLNCPDTLDVQKK